MKIVVGLGNPGKQYAETRHNVGYRVIERLASEFSCELRRSIRFKARIGKCSVGREPVWLLKSRTFMNESGLAVAPVLRKQGLTAGDLIVVLDDADLELGRLRIRQRGSPGGHRGLASIGECLGSTDFVRVRVGVGRAAGKELVEHVLGTFSGEERPIVEEGIARAAEAVLCMLREGLETAMNRFN